jgi:putative peptidoglycan lipid II flippase
MTTGIYRQIGWASLIMMGSIFLSRVAGLVREMSIAWIGGADAAVDAYRVAFVVPEILNHILASGFLSVTFIPIFSTYLANGREAEGWRVAALILTVFGLLLAVLTGAAFCLAPALIDLLAPGRTDPLFKHLAVRMTRIIMPAQLFFFWGGILIAVQFAKGRFGIPALAPLVYNLGIVAGGLVLAPRLGMEGFAWGVLAGSLAGNFLLQLWGARRAGMTFRPCFDWRHHELRRYVGLTLPLMLGLTMTFSTEIFSKFFGSFLPVGGISWIEYAYRIMLMLVAFFGQAVGVASYPFMARLAAEGRLEELTRLLDDMLRYLALVIPLSVVVMVLRLEVVGLLFRRGRFDDTDAAMTAGVLIYLMAGAVAFAAQTVVNRGFYARQNTLLPAVYGTLAALGAVPIYLAGLKLMGVAGVALAVSLAAVLQVLVLYAVWNRRSGNTGAPAVYGLYLRVAALSLPLGLILEALRRRLPFAGASSPVGQAATVILIGGAAMLLLLALGRLFRIRELQQALQRLLARVRR